MRQNWKQKQTKKNKDLVRVLQVQLEDTRRENEILYEANLKLANSNMKLKREIEKLRGGVKL